jgi:hypothetical protein
MIEKLKLLSALISMTSSEMETKECVPEERLLAKHHSMLGLHAPQVHGESSLLPYVLHSLQNFC